MGKHNNSLKYYTEINIMRGMLALLVVLGHVSTQIDLNNSFSSKAVYSLGRVIYSFHMPLFFVIAGFVSVKSLSLKSVQEKILYTEKRFNRLMVPYFVMGIVYLPFRIILKSIARTDYNILDFWKILIGQNPDGALWFLYVLFLVSIIGCWLVNEKTLVLAIIVTSILSLISPVDNLPMPINKFYLAPFYFIGIYIRLHYEIIKDKLDKTGIKLFAILLFVFSNYTMLIFGAYDCIVISKIVASFSGCFLIWGLSLIIAHNTKESILINWLKNQFNILGDYSMDIYMFAEPIKVVIRAMFRKYHLAIMVSLTFIISTTLAILTSKYMIRKIKILSKLFLGY